jgi:hypothetical protein
MQSQEKSAPSMTERLAEIDGFPVDWAGRDAKGNLTLSASVFRIVETPPEMFGQTMRDFGYETALALVEKGETPAPHDFGACFVRPKSLRREADGKWYVDLTVDPHHCRYPVCASQRVDSEGEPVLDEETGEPVIDVAPRKETWVTVELSWVSPMERHPLSFRYVQSDRRTTSMLKAADFSEKVAEGKTGKGKGGGRQKRRRLSPAEAAAAIAKARG